MRRLELDFCQPFRRPGRASYLLLLLALVVAADQSYSYFSLRREIAGKEVRIAKIAMGAAQIDASPRVTATAENLRFARDTVQRLAMPWGRLFDALEAAQSDRVSLLSIEPDSDGGRVTVTGEARDYLAALTYVANLSEHEGLRNVHLTRHEVRQNEPHQPLAFAVSATWRIAR